VLPTKTTHTATYLESNKLSAYHHVCGGRFGSYAAVAAKISFNSAPVSAVMLKAKAAVSPAITPRRAVRVGTQDNITIDRIGNRDATTAVIWRTTVEAEESE